MVLDLQAVEPARGILEQAVELGNAALVFGVVHQVGAAHRMEHQHVDARLAVAHIRRHPGAVIHEIMVFIVPGLLNEHARRMVPLAQAADGIPLKMRAQHIHPVDHLPAEDPAHFIKAQVPAAAGVGLGQLFGFAELHGRRIQLLGGQRRIHLPSQPVDAGELEVFIGRHHARGGKHLGVQIVLEHHVAGQLTVMRRTPVMDRLHEVMHHHVVDQAIKIIAEALRPFGIHKQQRQPVERTVAVPPVELLLQRKGIRNHIPAVLRLVGKKAAQALAEFVAEAPVILFVHAADKLVGALAAERVDIIPVDDQDHRAVGAVRRLLPDAAAVLPAEIAEHPVLRRQIADLPEFHALLLERFALLRHPAVRKPARPAVFIVRPGLHSQFLGGFDAYPHRFKPFLAHIRRFQAAACVHEEAADALLLHLPDLFPQPFRLQPVVPAPERQRAVGIRVDLHPSHVFLPFFTRPSAGLCKRNRPLRPALRKPFPVSLSLYSAVRQITIGFLAIPPSFFARPAVAACAVGNS